MQADSDSWRDHALTCLLICLHVEIKGRGAKVTGVAGETVALENLFVFAVLGCKDAYVSFTLCV